MNKKPDKLPKLTEIQWAEVIIAIYEYHKARRKFEKAGRILNKKTRMLK